MDNKLYTFLTVCHTMNYRKAAELLHLTQPAITKQIKSLEHTFQTRLFNYDGHILHKTESCLMLEQYAISMQYNYEELMLAMHKSKRTLLRIGATKTIGDYVLNPYLIQYLSVSENEASLTVSNTEQLLKMLDSNELDFAIIEGPFSKAKYGHYLLRNEPFVGACSIQSPMCGKTISIENLLPETLILREKGSGTRNILESRLNSYGYQINDFNHVISISSFNAIKHIVQAGIGITFLYESVIKEDKAIGTFHVNEVTTPHEFNVIYTKNSAARKYSKLFLGIQS